MRGFSMFREAVYARFAFVAMLLTPLYSKWFFCRDCYFLCNSPGVTEFIVQC